MSPTIVVNVVSRSLAVPSEGGSADFTSLVVPVLLLRGFEYGSIPEHRMIVDAWGPYRCDSGLRRMGLGENTSNPWRDKAMLGMTLPSLLDRQCMFCCFPQKTCLASPQNPKMLHMLDLFRADCHGRWPGT